MPPISAEPDPQSTRALKPVADSSGRISVAAEHRSFALVTLADLQRGDLTGLRLGHYELGKRVGHGGMGQVFLARHQALGKQFAIKFLAGDILQNPDAERRFQEEITSLGKLQHPNILSAVDAGRAGEVHYLVTEYVDGKDLARLVAEEGPLHPARARDFLRQAAAGLACAHAHGFIHRDIKPSNLIVDAHGTLRLLDFGLVRNLQESDGLTNAGQLLGTIDFLSPEQAADGRSADFRSDLYSVGCTLLFLLTGRPPFSGEKFASVAARIHGHLFMTPPALCEMHGETNCAIPEELSRILHRLLSKNPADRFQSANELIETLDGHRIPSSVDSGNVDSHPPTLVWSKRMGMSAVAALTLLVVGPLRNVAKEFRASENATITQASALTMETVSVDSGQLPEDQPAMNASSIVSIHEPEKSLETTNGQPSTEQNASIPSRSEATDESASERGLSTPEAPDNPTVHSIDEVSEHVAEAEQQSPPSVGTATSDAAETAEFQAAGNVNARRMELPGKLLSGKASGLLRSGRNRSQGE